MTSLSTTSLKGAAALPHARAKSLTWGVRDSLLDWIRQGKYPPGSQLPSMMELCKRLDVSRTVVREALQTLEGMKLIEIRPGMGCYVRAVPPELLVNSDVMAALLDMDTLIELAEARLLIEGAVAAAAAVLATEEDFEEIELSLHRIERAVAKSAPMFSLTPAFHVAIAHAAHNRILEQVVQSFNSLMSAAGSIIEQVHFGPAFREREYVVHKQLLDALRSGDPDVARREMEGHIRVTIHQLMEIRSRKTT